MTANTVDAKKITILKTVLIRNRCLLPVFTKSILLQALPAYKIIRQTLHALMHW